MHAPTDREQFQTWLGGVRALHEVWHHADRGRDHRAGAPAYPASSAEMWQELTDARTDEFRNSRLRNDSDVEGALDGATVIEAGFSNLFFSQPVTTSSAPNRPPSRDPTPR